MSTGITAILAHRDGQLYSVRVAAWEQRTPLFTSGRTLIDLDELERGKGHEFVAFGNAAGDMVTVNSAAMHLTDGAIIVNDDAGATLVTSVTRDIGRVRVVGRELGRTDEVRIDLSEHDRVTTVEA